MSRILAIDPGTVRIGLALSDPLGMFAQPLEVLANADGWETKVLDIIKTYDVRTVLIGKPTRTTGVDGPESQNALDMTKKLAELLEARDVEIKFHDERYTTKIATNLLLEADVSRKGRKKVVDKVAAAVLLQSYLDVGKI